MGRSFAIRVIAVTALLGTLAASWPRAWAEEPDEAPSIPRLPAVEVRAPRLYGGPAASGPETAVTPLRHEGGVFDAPSAVTVATAEDLHQRRLVRSAPDALLRLPGVLVQKTGPLQASPFIRGFTGYANLLMIDGIRLNHAAFRGGPNQYWSTVDAYTIGRLEVARGPHSVLYGSDAVGGTVNAIPWRRSSFEPGLHWSGAMRARGASAENALFGRVQVEGNYHDVGWAGGISYRRYGAIVSGNDRLIGTGGITDFDADLRTDMRLSRLWELSVAWQHVDQTAAPRTETTVDSIPFHGTVPGSELKRDHDQRRDLLYARLRFDGGDCGAPIARGHVTVSYHRHEEERDRERSGNRRDLSGFTLGQLGVQAQLESPTRFGRFTYGAQWYHDEVDTFRRDYVGGALTLAHVQGPLGDDAAYDLLGVYLQDEVRLGRLDVIAGARFTYAAAQADRVDNPAVAGNDSATPGNVIAVENDWTALVGSLRAAYHVNRCWNVFGGVSQAFRAPSLHDLTSLDSTSVVETPAPRLGAERYVSFELGVKTEQRDVAGYAAAWYTLMEDTIIRSPTGAVIDGVPEVRKDNIGDGGAWGIEAEVAWRFRPAWTLFGNVSWMDAEVDELDAATGGLVRSPLSRMKPLTTLVGLRYEPRGGGCWAQADWAWSDAEDRLSLRDEADRRRIPPGGTPSWSVVSLRAGWQLGSDTHVSFALENLFDEDYRIHGSGQNEPGFNVVVGLAVDM